MGAGIVMGENWIEAGAGEAARGGGRLRAIDADFNHIPDYTAMTIAVAALFADGVSGAAQHRQLAREGNRPHRGHGEGVAQTRRKRGRRRGLFPRITPPLSGLASGASIDTYDDHRMAMCSSLAALGGVAVRSTIRTA